MKKYLSFLFINHFVICFSLWGQRSHIEIPEVGSYKCLASGINGAPTLASGENFGRSVANIGDLDNDGITDLAVGSFSYNSNTGAIYICFMDASDEIDSYVIITSDSIGGSLSSGDGFGISIAGLGDINGDGNEDIVVGAHNDDAGSLTDCGALYVIFLASNGSVNSYTAIGNNMGGIPLSVLENSGRFGVSVANLGDIDNDGINDIGAGAHGTNGSGTDRGAVFTLRINSSGAVKTSGYTKVGDNTGGFPSGVLSSSDFFGVSVAGPGDLDNDGQPDMIVGALGDDDGFADAGAFYVVYLSNTGSELDNKKLSYPLMSNSYFPNYTDIDFGNAIGLADLNGDKILDIVAGVPTFSSNKGGLYVLTLDTAEDVTGFRNIGFNYAWSYNGPATAPCFGKSVANYTDSGDFRIKLVVGAYFHNQTAANQGSAYVITLDSLTYQFNTGTVLDYVKIGDYSGNFTGTLLTSDFFGLDATTVGDLDNDGNLDIVVGAQGDDNAGSTSGAAWVLFLDDRGKVSSYQKIQQSSTNFGSPLTAGDRLGWGVGPAGDFDNDGVEDVVIGAAGDDDGGGDRGAFYLIYLNSNGTIKTTNKICDTSAHLTLINTDLFGIDIDSIGDLNDDGVLDFVVGAYQNDDGGVGTSANRGAVYIVYMNSNGTVKKYAAISDTRGSFSETFATDDFFGIAVEGIGDFNGDGIEDIAVGSHMNGTGAVHIIYLDTSGTVLGFKKINNAASNFPYTLPNGGAFGSSIQMVPDIDGNGVKDLIISSIHQNTYGFDRGMVWLTMIDSFANVIDAIPINDSAGHFYANLYDNELLGYCVRYYGVDDDGNLKVIFGSADDEGGTDKSAVFLTTISIASNSVPSGNFAQLKRKPDAGTYTPSNGYVRFIYDEEYQVGSSKNLQYKLYKDDHELIGQVDETGMAVITGSPLIPVVYGKNRITANFNPLALTSGYYLLEVTTAKNEKRYFKFRK